VGAACGLGTGFASAGAFLLAAFGRVHPPSPDSVLLRNLYALLHRSVAGSGPVLRLLARLVQLRRPGPDQDVPAPIQVTSSAYEAAAVSQLPEQAPIEYPGLHHLFWLSDDILSGAEPEGDVALEKLAEMGIKTILSVDGKAPDAETAKKLGMRYVHVPIRYRGIEQDELLKIAKTFRELEGPFYVHCYHGVHRGPAAAAVGRVVLDGAPREQAIAEMRQYCGTSSKYEGLYGAIAFGQLPSAEETQAYPFGFEAQHQFRGFRHAMVDLARSWDLIKPSPSATGSPIRATRTRAPATKPPKWSTCLRP
jgi:protein tyrosine phosphatase (PTP) superfamily phosphohydrolase (DUF442 family)